MKKSVINLSLAFFTLTMVFFCVSCTEESDNDGPQISFANNINSTTLAKGVTEWQVNATITSTVNLKEIKLYQVYSGGEDQLGEAITSFPDKTSYDLKFTLTNVTEMTVIKISATDKDNLTNSRNFTINVTPPDPPATEDKLIFWTGTLAAQLGAQSASSGSAYATSTGSVYTKTAALNNASKIDFIYFYKADDATILAEIISPKFAETNYTTYVSGWAVKNETKFKKVSVTPAEFDAIVKTDDSPITAVATGLTEIRVVNLVVGNVFVFETAAGKKGLAKVTGLTGTTAGIITIEVKVQK